MGDIEGKFRISYYSSNTSGTKKKITLDLGSIVSINQSINKATSTIPLVSMGADRAFQLETGSTMQYNISFKRKNPSNHDNASTDSTKWSNRKWYNEMTALVDRWQMKTDGCRLTYEPDVTNPYVPAINVNGYIKILTRKYTNKFNELIEGSIQFIVGTIYVIKSLKAQPDQKEYVPVTLMCGQVRTTSEQINDISSETEDAKRKYALGDVVYTIESKEERIGMPDMPPLWGAYSTYTGYMLSNWKIYYTNSEGTWTQVEPTANHPPGSSIKVNIPDGYKLVLIAEWKK